MKHGVWRDQAKPSPRSYTPGPPQSGALFTPASVFILPPALLIHFSDSKSSEPIDKVKRPGYSFKSLAKFDEL